MTNSVPAHILNVLVALRDAGHRSWLVGGAVRDMVLGRDRADFDIATPATPEQVMQVFTRAIPTGIEHGTVTVVINKEPVEITTFRGDGAYTDGRRPDSVTFLTDITEDLARRDFTVNAMAYDPLTGEFADPFDGRADAAARVLRAVRNPYERFGEDGLRIMRAFRFAAELGFKIEPQTLKAAESLQGMLGHVAQERKTKEFLRLLVAKHAVEGLTALTETGVLTQIIPEVLSVAAYGICEEVERETTARLAAMLLPYMDDEKQTQIVCERLKLSSVQTEHVVRITHAAKLLVHYQGPMLSPYDARRWAATVRPERVDAALQVAKVYGGRMAPMEESIMLALDGGVPLYVSDLKVNGNDLKALGLQGKQIGVTLKFLLDAVLKDPAKNTRESLLTLVEVA